MDRGQVATGKVTDDSVHRRVNGRSRKNSKDRCKQTIQGGNGGEESWPE